jgi:formylglycine-generating enzyme required for sulfatase activity
MRLVLMCLLLWVVQSALAQSTPAPEHLRIKYYYQTGDSVIPAIKPAANLIKLLKDWKFLHPDSTRVEPCDGFDSILPLYHYDFMAKHGGFFFLPTEISNLSYRKFVQSTRNPAHTPDTNCWLGPKPFSEPLSHYYFQHPAYNDFPVCGVSFLQAKAYCQWLQDSLNQVLSQKKIPQRVEVDLPSSDEWVNIYYHAIRQHEIKNRQKLPKPTYLQFASPGNQNKVISGPWYSERMAHIKPIPLDYYVYTAAIKGVGPVGGVYQIMGNVAEWTRSSAQNHLFNHKEYIYTVTGRITPNVYEKHSAATLEKYIRGEAMNNLMVIKGGSWQDDPYYLQPGALYLFNKNKASSKIGFRPIIRVVNP